MENTFISAKQYKKYLTLLTKLIDLPTSVMLPTDEGVPKESLIFHKMVLHAYNIDTPMLDVESYVIYPAEAKIDLFGQETISIDPEIEFHERGIFWVGSSEKIFTDSAAVIGKKQCKFSWLSSYEREVAYQTFDIGPTPFFVSTYPLRVLDALQTDESKKPKAVFVGTVELDGRVIPAVTRNHTLNDGPQDMPTLGARPNF